MFMHDYSLLLLQKLTTISSESPMNILTQTLKRSVNGKSYNM